MGTAAIAWMCFALLLGQAQADNLFYTNSRSQQIPLGEITDEQRAAIDQFRLYVSNDLGRNWTLENAITPDKGAFTFYGRKDGTYWFRVAVVNKQGKQVPENILQGRPDQILVIDTLKPIVRALRAVRSGDEVQVQWEVQEENLDAEHGFQLEYQPRDGSNRWLPVKATPALTGTARFLASMPVTVRLSLKDLADNSSYGLAEVSGGIATASAGGLPSPPVSTLLHPEPEPRPGERLVGSSGAMPLPPPTPPGNNGLIQPPTLATEIGLPPTNSNAFESRQSASVVPPPPGLATPGMASPEPQPDPLRDRTVIADSTAPKPAPHGRTPADLTETRTSGSSPAAAARRLPELNYVNQPEVTLEYEVSRVGPSGLDKVDLWWTQNDGQTWKFYAYDDTVNGTTQPGRHRRTVELPGEGVFGFKLVLKNRANVSNAPPNEGDIPEIRFEVDTVPPVVKMLNPVPDTKKPNTLVFDWTASDKNLTDNPVNLEWSEKRDGPWQPIAVDLPNTGSYGWALPRELPLRVYFRIRVRDKAGNEGTATSHDSHFVDLSEPEGRLVNFSVAPKR